MINSLYLNRSFSEIIRYPIITDKATQLLENNQYSFIVDPKSTKRIIKKAVEYLFNVEFNMPSLFAENMQVDTLNLSLGYPAEEAVGHEDF